MLVSLKSVHITSVYPTGTEFTGSATGHRQTVASLVASGGSKTTPKFWLLKFCGHWHLVSRIVRHTEQLFLTVTYIRENKAIANE